MIQTRTFDKLCHEVVDAPLERLGFAWSGKGVYARSDSDGEDIIGFGFRPSRDRFCVMIGYWPMEFRILEELHPELKTSDRGFCCRPYLNPEGASWNPRWFRTNDRESTIRGLETVVPWIEDAGVAWLASLRDRARFADHTDPVAALPSGLAHELAGNTEIARERYREMNRRFEEIDRTLGGIRKYPDMWRDFIFVRTKLGLEDALTAEIRAAAEWNPTIQPLPC